MSGGTETSGNTVLLVEDEPLLGRLLSQRLEREGFAVILVKDGEEALEALGETTPDLILMDIILPKMSGFDLMEKFRNDPGFAERNVPVVIISNLAQESDVQRGEELGAVGYFVKAQLSIEDLVGQVKQFFAG